MAMLIPDTLLADEPPISHEVLCRKKPHCHTTLMARLTNAPFPFEGRSADGSRPFFDRIDPETGQRLHSVSDEVAYPEFPHYQDNRVLIHLPPHFKPKAPLEILVFLHGHNAELNRTLVEEMALLQQVNAAKRNLVLVAPQMVLDGADSSPGKLGRPKGLENLLKEVSRLLGKKMGRRFADRFDRAPVILAAYSGGYRATAMILDKGFAEKKRRDKRLRGVILVDAVYSDSDKFLTWLRQPKRRGFFVNLYGPSSAPLSKQLEEEFKKFGLSWSDGLKGRIKSGNILSLSVETHHKSIFQAGPPHWPLAEILNKVAVR
ncbi:MAG: hypothetical protein HQL95_00135 [Magnetococcales bacterium]|nr:hypothetical protein [Magnetococcales bacterium]